MAIRVLFYKHHDKWIINSYPIYIYFTKKRCYLAFFKL